MSNKFVREFMGHSTNDGSLFIGQLVTRMPAASRVGELRPSAATTIVASICWLSSKVAIDAVSEQIKSFTLPGAIKLIFLRSFILCNKA